MDLVLFSIGVVGNVISVLMFASPITTFWRIIQSRSTGDFEATPYVVTLLSSSFWVYYGVTKPDAFLVATVNGVGAVLEAIYVFLFLLYAKPPQRMKTAALVGGLDVGAFGAVFLVTWFGIHHESARISVIGTIGAFLNILMYGSPLAAVKTVINTKSVEFMPFFLSLFLFLNGGVWTAYAILAQDVFLGIPNGIGFFLGLIQLVIYMIYKNRKASRNSNETVEENQQPLI
ncbi:Bidirectional sugar transporter SWEET [Rhynchospora pubera]|uniref:Bidirectional sugar transporter SWEET n=1 Tax=Rhynchospora pubera TaxID=906938 RepID=A0AAV8ECX4_9POAL|nr:Bidirectional sugar transporter SWEET [Rhynchospora pubera]